MTSLDSSDHPSGTPKLDPVSLLADLKVQVGALEVDLLARAGEEPKSGELRAEYDAARQARRTAATYSPWLKDRVTQAAVAWVLSTVFVRYCEDNGLIEVPFLAGPTEGEHGSRLALAEARYDAFLDARPGRNYRDWLEAAFEHLAAAHPTTAALFDRDHNPIHDIQIGYDAARALVDFWQRLGAGPEIAHDFTGSDTRFLGDLYQNLSESAREKYALLQTPDFVEEFILDLTLDPALEEFGLGGPEAAESRGFRAIDPTCGSGHFLLGLFHRILAAWEKEAPGADPWVLIRRAMGSVHGVDKNPFAVSVARFRLLDAALTAGGERLLSRASEFPINIAVGDSLIHGKDAPQRKKGNAVLFAIGGEWREHTYTTEDINLYVDGVDLLRLHSYHAVVGNPPYITVKDKEENESYRERYPASSGKYSLTVPFAQRFFDLAMKTAGGDLRGGFVGQITANSFMKREFGKKLIEEFFVRVDLTHVIDASGAYIPGHGTPTTILVGRNQIGAGAASVRAVLGIRGEPTQPKDAARGEVWRAIVDQIGDPGSESSWVGVADLDRATFAKFPWSLSGGGAAELVQQLESAGVEQLSARLHGKIGFASFPGQDEAFFLPWSWFGRRAQAPAPHRPLVIGEVVRDWGENIQEPALVPYSPENKELSLDGKSDWGRHLWALRTVLLQGQADDGFQVESARWWTWYRWVPERYETALSLTFAFVSTHNHFVLDRGGKVFKQSAPVIKLPAQASEDDHLALLGVLNSSTACFWLKQVSQGKGGSGLGRGLQDEAWEERYEFTGTKLEQFPLPDRLSLEMGRTLDTLAHELAELEPSVTAGARPLTRARLTSARADWTHLHARMIAAQEELDWLVYGQYGLLSDPEISATTAPNRSDVPELALGDRAFEFVLARQAEAGEVNTAWFERHRSTPITEIPAHWPDDYRRIVQARIDLIEKRRDLALIERPECKRRWATEPWEVREEAAVRTWLLDRAEQREIWFAAVDGMIQPRPLTINQLADALSKDPDVVSVAQLYAADHLKKPDLTLAEVLDAVLAKAHVPYLSAVRYKPSGLTKRADWEEVWEQQREEDRTGERLDIAVPPKYASADFLKPSYWSQRGKLDVPKERFVSYPGASPDGDPTLLLGWAGWDHREQAQALVRLVVEGTEQAGWGVEKVTPLLAGLAEVLPWVKQWHAEYDADWGGVPAEEFATFLDSQRTRFGLREDDLKQWRPAPPTRGRRSSG